MVQLKLFYKARNVEKNFYNCFIDLLFTKHNTIACVNVIQY